MTLYQELLTELIPLVAKKLAQQAEEAGDFDMTDGQAYAAWRERSQAAIGRLKEFFAERYDARFTQHGDVCTVHMAGLRSGSTSGWLGAMRNWRRAAEAKAGAAR